MDIKSHKDLRVYQVAIDSAMRIHALTRSWPDEERYSMTSQILRSSRSICANIGEAWIRRPYPRHFSSKLRDAGGEAAETIVWLELASLHGYIGTDDLSRLMEAYQFVHGGLIKMSNQPKKWCFPPP
ncbi:MAG: four helix bundle protein [Bacteroidetes bacterium]|nr:four helix bundle protein [Bacteroidota bacterium]